MPLILYVLASVLLVSLVAVMAALPLITRRHVPAEALVTLLSISVGTLLGAVFIHFLPEVVLHGYTPGVAFSIIAGFLTFFMIEKLIHYHHRKNCRNVQGHSHAYSLAPINLIGDAIHNFIDGLVIAGAYVASIPLGIAATVSVVFHEIPQEIADMGVLLYAGMEKKKALLLNFLSALTAVAGALLGFLLSGSVHGFSDAIIPFAMGNFLYIAAANLVPELHRHCRLKDACIHLLAILFGIGIMASLVLLGLGHAH